MVARQANVVAEARRRSWLSRLKLPAVLLLILLNVVYFGGNAALDLWQVVGPATAFSGSVVSHDRIVTTGENAQEFLILAIATGHGSQLKVQVPGKAFDATVVGQQVSGQLDARGLFDHDQALRSLANDGGTVYMSSPLRRSASQLIILTVVATVGTAALRWLFSRRRASSGAGEAGHPVTPFREA